MKGTLSAVFEDHWNFIVNRSKEACIPVVQDKAELEYVYNLMKDCTSYLEVGTAEGNSLYVLTNAMPKGSEITYIDLAEPHTKPHRDMILERLKDYEITPIHMNSNDREAIQAARTAFYTKHHDRNEHHGYDMVLIDAGHEDFNVVIDALWYGELARKYIVFHDIQIPDVRRAFEWYCHVRKYCKNYRVVNSENYGYGIIEV